jgi:hypothetical protein
MSRYLLKDSDSKRLFAEWLNYMTASYAIDAMLKWADEDALCEHFFSCIRGTLKTPTGILTVKSYKTRGRGPGAAEKKLGADGICIVDIVTPNISLKGFFLFQAKRPSCCLTPFAEQATNARRCCHIRLQATF